MQDATRERIFQDEVVRQMVSGGWLEGTGAGYNAERLLPCWHESMLKRLPMGLGHE